MVAIRRRDPFREFALMRGAMDRFFLGGLARPRRVVTWETGQTSFPVDVYETDDEVVIKGSLPGVKAEDVAITVADGTLTIKAETKGEEEEKRPSYYRQERRYGAFERSLTLPVAVDSDKAEAEFENGVLHLRLPKAPELRSRSIPVRAQGAIEEKTS